MAQPAHASSGHGSLLHLILGITDEGQLPSNVWSVHQPTTMVGPMVGEQSLVVMVISNNGHYITNG